MAFSIPTLSQLIARIEQSLATRLNLSLPQIRRTNVGVLSRVQAEASFSLVEYQGWIADQVIYDTAEAEILARWAAIWGIARVPASAAAGDVVFTGTNGTVIPAGTLLQRADGAEYTTDEEATIAAGEATVAVTASAPGAAGNAEDGELLDMVSPIAGLNAQATVDGELAGGADVETDASLRARLLGRIRTPPHGGNADDYRKWVLETEGVTVARRGPNDGDELVWVCPLELGLGTVTIRFMCDDGAGFMRVPTTEEVALVQAHIDSVRPVTADVTVVAPIAEELDIEIELTPDTATVRAAVQAEVKDLLLREAEPGGTILISHLREAVSIAAGETDHAFTAPVADIDHTTGMIAMPGAYTWS